MRAISNVHVGRRVPIPELNFLLLLRVSNSSSRALVFQLLFSVNISLVSFLTVCRTEDVLNSLHETSFLRNKCNVFTSVRHLTIEKQIVIIL